MCCSPKNNFKALLFILVFAFSPLVFKAQNHAQHDAHDTETGAAKAEHAAPVKEKKFDAAEVIFGHVLDGHEYHFMDIGEHPVTLPLPIILYSPSRGTWDIKRNFLRGQSFRLMPMENMILRLLITISL